jgi:hypothetical protein
LTAETQREERTMANHPTNEEHETDMAPEELTQPAGHRLSARNDPSMRDGNSGRGNPHEYPPDEENSDRDVGDTAEEAAQASEEVGVLDAVPANQAGLDATAEVDEQIDDRGTAASPDTGRGTEDSGEFAATVGDNSPAELEADMSPDDEAPAGGDTRANQGADLPIDDFQHLTVKQVVAKLGELPENDLRRVRDYERSHRRRKTLLVQLERRLQGMNKRSDGSRSRLTAHPGPPGG